MQDFYIFVKNFRFKKSDIQKYKQIFQKINKIKLEVK